MVNKNESVNGMKPEETLEKKSDKKKIDKKLQAKKKKSCKSDKKKSEPGIEELKAEIKANKNRILRISAEFENYKKRVSKEMDDFRKFANETLFKQLLTVVDNLERAISSSEECSDAKPLLEGIKMTYKEIMKFFETFNVKPVKAQGKPFDPAFHQAVSQQESNDYPANTVLAELQKGYLLHDRLIRPSMVVVSKVIEKNETNETKDKKE